jgi:predicted phosphodiesterase
MNPDYIAVKESQEIDEILKDIQQEIIACGHSHIPRVVKTQNKTIINPGSVGLPAYDDELPIPHKMENYNPNANYIILTLSEKPLKIEHVSIAYDYEPAANMAEKNERKDWAKWIRTGIA